MIFLLKPSVEVRGILFNKFCNVIVTDHIYSMNASPNYKGQLAPCHKPLFKNAKPIFLHHRNVLCCLPLECQYNPETNPLASCAVERNPLCSLKSMDMQFLDNGTHYPCGMDGNVRIA